MAPLDLVRIRARYASLDEARLLDDIDRGPAGYSSPDVWSIILEEAAKRGIETASRIAPLPPLHDLVAGAVASLPPSVTVLDGPFAPGAWFFETGALKLEILKRCEGRVTSGTIDSIGDILHSSLRNELRLLRQDYHDGWIARGFLVLIPSEGPLAGTHGSSARTLAGTRIVFAAKDIEALDVVKDAVSSSTSSAVRAGLIGGAIPALIGNAIANAAELDVALLRLRLNGGGHCLIRMGGTSARFLRGLPL